MLNAERNGRNDGTELILMDPQVALRLALNAAQEYYELDRDERDRGATSDTSEARRRQLADLMAMQLRDLERWTWDGGYPPNWPQRPLTAGEHAELKAAGHRA